MGQMHEPVRLSSRACREWRRRGDEIIDGWLLLCFQRGVQPGFQARTGEEADKKT